MSEKDTRIVRRAVWTIALGAGVMASFFPYNGGIYWTLSLFLTAFAGVAASAVFLAVIGRQRRASGDQIYEIPKKIGRRSGFAFWVVFLIFVPTFCYWLFVFFIFFSAMAGV